MIAVDTSKEEVGGASRHTPVTIINLSLSTQVCIGFADLGAVDVLLFSFTVSCEPTCGFCCGCSLGVNAVAVE
jgi:hypothetical protein